MTASQITPIDPSFVDYASTLWQLKTTDKLGLALSGGGFRASLFHIGVLARMAELDLLRHVSVLSTVSGGSIIGAYYYLKLKQLLEGERIVNGAQVKPTSQAYVDIIHEIEKEFLEAVQTNIRIRALIDPVANAKMIFSDDYSRSDRISEVYNDCFYRKFTKNQDGKFRLPELKITPFFKSFDHGSKIREYNSTAEYKIPILNINATLLNTGGRWTFTATDLGEAPARDSIGTIPAYERIRYDDNELTLKKRKKLEQIGLSDAVAASACVPAIFTPLAIHDLYQPEPNGDEIVVELVDGGVYDNQGAEALISENCNYIICSDASGQLDESRTPNRKLLPVATRANDILMTRVRAECYTNLCVNPGSGRIAFFHLRDKFIGAKDFPPLPPPADHAGGKSDGHIYALSNIRTDLDAFSDIEAFSLMYDGYCLSDYFLQRDKNNSGLDGISSLGTLHPQTPWHFLSICSLIKGNDTVLLDHLKVGRFLFFKPFYLAPARAFSAAFLLLLPIFALMWHNIDKFKDLYEIFINFIVYYGLVIGLLALPVYVIVKALNDAPMILKAFDYVRKYRKSDNGLLIGVFIIPGIIGAVGAAIQLGIFNKIFIRAGKLRQIN